MTDAKIDIEAPVAQATLPAPSLNSDEDDSNSTTLEYKDYPDQLPSYSLDAADKSPGLFLWLKTIFHWRSNALIPILSSDAFIRWICALSASRFSRERKSPAIYRRVANVGDY